MLYMIYRDHDINNISIWNLLWTNVRPSTNITYTEWDDI